MSAELVRRIPSERTEELCNVVRALEALGLDDVADHVRQRVWAEDVVCETALVKTLGIYDWGEL